MGDGAPKRTEMKYVFQVEPAAAGAGPVYRSVFAKDGLLEPTPGLSSCWDLFCASVEKFPNNPMLGRREIVDGKAGKYIWSTYKEVHDTVLKVASSLSATGIKKGGRCGIYSVNCPEWIISMEACNALGIYCVPLYDTLGADAVEFVINHAEIEIVFAEERKISEVLKNSHSTNKHLKTIVSFSKITSEQKEAAEKHGLSLYTLNDFLTKQGANQPLNLPEKKESDICTIFYTSGTTGDPKGVLLSNRSLLTIVAGVSTVVRNAGQVLDERDVYMSYLPLAHAFDRIFEEAFISIGARIGFWRGDVKLLVEDLKELQPTFFCAVPRVLDRIYSGIKEKISSGSLLKRFLFNLAYNTKLGNMKKGINHESAAPFYDHLVFSKIKEGLGGKVRYIVSGGAPLSSEVEEFLRVVTCASLVQGYGLTETCAGTVVGIPNVYSMVGTVGPPVQHTEVCLKSVPEMGYDAVASIPRGEVCFRGNTLFSGYHKRDDLTKEAFVDGWFHSGDIGEWQPDGSLKIIDRKKNIFKLSQGEYVAVEVLENIYSILPDIDMIWVYGNSFESFLVAVVNPNASALKNWAESNGIRGEFAELCAEPRVKQHILDLLAKVAKEKKLKGFEFVKAIHLDPVPFDMERDLLTPTYKLKRPNLLKYYKSVIDELYNSKK